MKREINLNVEQFELIDFTEGSAIVNQRQDSFDEFVVYVYGLTIMKKDFKVFDISDDDFESDVYLRGFAKLTFSKYSILDVNVDLLSYKSPFSFNKFIGNYKYTHKMDDNTGDISSYVYEMEFSSVIPFGRGELEIRADNSVRLEMDTNDMILVSEYTLNPIKNSLL